MNTQSVKLGAARVLVITAVGLALAAANLTDGAVLIVDPTGVVASSTFGPRIAGHLIDNSGLSSALNTGDPVPGTYPTHDEANPSDTMYLSAENQPLPTITFLHHIFASHGVGLLWLIVEALTCEGLETEGEFRVTRPAVGLRGLVSLALLNHSAAADLE